MEQITGSQIIDTAKRMLKVTISNEWDADFMIWLQMGWRNLYNINTYPMQDVYIPLSNGSCKKPVGVYEFVGAALNSENAVVYYNNKYFSNKNPTSPIDVSYYNWINTVEERGGRYYFGSLASEATQCHLWYKGLPVSEDCCDIMFSIEEEEPLSYYLCFKYCESGNGLDLEQKKIYFGTMFDNTAKILRGRIARKVSSERQYQQTSTAIGILNSFPY